jgi:hypothetical protein
MEDEYRINLYYDFLLKSMDRFENENDMLKDSSFVDFLERFFSDEREFTTEEALLTYYNDLSNRQPESVIEEFSRISKESLKFFHIFTYTSFYILNKNRDDFSLSHLLNYFFNQYSTISGNEKSKYENDLLLGLILKEAIQLNIPIPDFIEFLKSDTLLIVLENLDYKFIMNSEFLLIQISNSIRYDKTLLEFFISKKSIPKVELIHLFYIISQNNNSNRVKISEFLLRRNLQEEYKLFSNKFSDNKFIRNFISFINKNEYENAFNEMPYSLNRVSEENIFQLHELFLYLLKHPLSNLVPAISDRHSIILLLVRFIYLRKQNENSDITILNTFKELYSGEYRKDRYPVALSSTERDRRADRWEDKLKEAIFSIIFYGDEDACLFAIEDYISILEKERYSESFFQLELLLLFLATLDHEVFWDEFLPVITKLFRKSKYPFADHLIKDYLEESIYRDKCITTIDQLRERRIFFKTHYKNKEIEVFTDFQKEISSNFQKLLKNSQKNTEEGKDSNFNLTLFLSKNENPTRGDADNGEKWNDSEFTRFSNFDLKNIDMGSLEFFLSNIDNEIYLSILDKKAEEIEVFLANKENDRGFFLRHIFCFYLLKKNQNKKAFKHIKKIPKTVRMYNKFSEFLVEYNEKENSDTIIEWCRDERVDFKIFNAVLQTLINENKDFSINTYKYLLSSHLVPNKKLILLSGLIWYRITNLKFDSLYPKITNKYRREI